MRYPKAIVLSMILLAGTASLPPAVAGPEGLVPYIETHAHLDNVIAGRRASSRDFSLAVVSADDTMTAVGVQRTLLMPHPQAASDISQAYDIEELVAALSGHADRFSLLGGGGSLLRMIHNTPPEQVTDDVRETFRRRAMEIVKQGAVGFGEMSFEHFSLHEKHFYHVIPADHPLYLLLADIAAEQRVVIDLHGEALEQDRPMPALVRGRSINNPPAVRANLPALERLLAHNRQARIVWVHVGWDLTGERSVALTRRLLAAHPNLYVSIKIVPGHTPFVTAANRPDTETGTVRPEWVQLIRDFPDRFVIGSDQFYVGGHVSEDHVRFKGAAKRARLSRRFLNSLPADLARKVGFENAVQIYRLPAAGGI